MLGHRDGGPGVTVDAAPQGLGHRTRETRVLRPVVVWLRAGAIGFAWVLIALGQRPVSAAWLVTVTVLLLAFFAWRVAAPPSTIRQLRAVVVAEPFVAAAALLLSGGWASPFVLYVAIPMLTVAVAVGPRVAFMAAGFVTVLGVHEAFDATAVSTTEITQTLVPMAVAAGAGLVARRLFTQVEDEHDRSLGHVQELSHVNALLSSLHDLVRSSPAPLTVEDVLQVVRSQIDELFDADAILLLVADEGGRWWRPVSVEGTAVGRQIARADLPPELLAAIATTPVEIPRLAEGAGISAGARSGAYLWLFRRGRPDALLVLESHRVRRLPQARLEVLERMAAPLALAIDNAIWFQRLRTLGAEQERQRLGAALHDQFAQSLAYVTMELERLVRAHPDDGALARLHTDVRATLSDLRETLRELRLRCTEEQGLAATLTDHAGHFGDRFGVVVEVEATGQGRAPLSVENQLLRVAQDLLVLACREAGAARITVRLSVEPGRVRLVVGDDGSGTPEDRLGHEASLLLSVVRERADAIGGLVDVLIRPGDGTEVAVTVRGLLE